MSKNSEIGMERPKILLVEDTEDDAFFFEYSIADTGIRCEYFRVCDGQEAISFLQKHPQDPHLVFLDMNMPGLNGLDVLRWLQQQWFKDQKEIIVLSGSQNSDDIALPAVWVRPIIYLSPYLNNN
jgi:CheY-like chemotaxis protein